MARVTDGDDRYEAAEELLKNALEEHIMCGEKIVQLFNFEEEDLDELRQAAQELEVDESPFSEAYPLLLNEDQLRAQQGQPPVLIAKVAYDDGLALVLASVRYLTTRETVIVAELRRHADAAVYEFTASKPAARKGSARRLSVRSKLLLRTTFH